MTKRKRLPDATRVLAETEREPAADAAEMGVEDDPALPMLNDDVKSQGGRHAPARVRVRGRPH